MENIFRLNATAKNIKSTADLFYLKLYADFDNDKQIISMAEKIFIETNDVYKVHEYFRSEQNRKLAEKYKKQANISKRFKTRTFENFKRISKMQFDAYEKAFNYAKNINENIASGTNIIFTGAGCVGTGKTHLACAIANEILNKGIPVKVINIVSLVDELKSFTNEFKKELQNVQVLLIDDLGKENGTLWLCSEIYSIINSRYENQLPTIITTEGKLNDLENNYKIEVSGKIQNKGCSMISRLMESCFVVMMNGEDFRITKGGLNG